MLSCEASHSKASQNRSFERSLARSGGHPSACSLTTISHHFDAAASISTPIALSGYSSPPPCSLTIPRDLAVRDRWRSCYGEAAEASATGVSRRCRAALGTLYAPGAQASALRSRMSDPSAALAGRVSWWTIPRQDTQPSRTSWPAELVAELRLCLALKGVYRRYTCACLYL